MRETFMKNFKGFFNDKPKNEEKKALPKEPMGSRLVSFGTPIKTKEEEEDAVDDGQDQRYNQIEEYPPLKELGLRKDEIEEGECAVLVQTKFALCKFDESKYEETTLIVTNYKICLKSPQSSFVFFPLGKVDRLSRYTTNESIFKMQIQLKDGRKFKFRVVSEQCWKKIYERVEMFAFIRSKKNFFAFRHFAHNSALEEEKGGWKLYDPIKEFHRMGITMMPHTKDTIKQFTSDFKILENKSEDEICSTYPSILVVPSRMPYESLRSCAKFRTKERLPALTYAYQYERDKFSCIYRSSQNKVGIGGNRSIDDEMMLRMIGNHQADPNATNNDVINCKIYDARGYYAALGNRMAGKGFESEEFYSNCRLEFLNIPNIHKVRESYNQTVEAAFGEDSKFYVTLAEAKWYEYIFLILYGALSLAKNLSNGINCLVHCSDGWDRTAQLCSLGAMLLDPFYRTIKGFEILIEKDWMHFGHQFAKRLGQGMNNPDNEDKSQIFLQFLDCTTQIMYQFPSEFEFNYRFIQDIGEQAYSNLFGNFLSNCEKEMFKHSIPTRTVSLWSKIALNTDIYLNPFYMPLEKTLLGFDPNEKNMRFWKEHFLQYVDDFRDVYGIYSCKFTEENLEIMHRHITQEKILLEERFRENESILSELDGKIGETMTSNQAQLSQL